MDTFKVGVKFGTEQKAIELTVTTDTEATSVSGRYLTLILPTSESAAKTMVSFDGTGKAEVEVIFDDDRPGVDIELKVTAGASEDDVTLGLVGPDDTNYQSVGKTGTSLLVTLPFTWHPNHDAAPHNSTQVAPEDVELVAASEPVGAPQPGNPESTLVS